VVLRWFMGKAEAAGARLQDRVAWLEARQDGAASSLCLPCSARAGLVVPQTLSYGQILRASFLVAFGTARIAPVVIGIRIVGLQPDSRGVILDRPILVAFVTTRIARL
jgi:hypothetical protein